MTYLVVDEFDVGLNRRSVWVLGTVELAKYEVQVYDDVSNETILANIGESGFGYYPDSYFVECTQDEVDALVIANAGNYGHETLNVVVDALNAYASNEGKVFGVTSGSAGWTSPSSGVSLGLAIALGG